MYCPDCGRANPPGAGFCTFCGSLMSNNPSTRKAAPRREAKEPPTRPASSARERQGANERVGPRGSESMLERWWNYAGALEP